MNGDDLCFLPISELSRLIQQKELSPVDLVQAYLDRIAAHDAVLNSFITVTADLALDQAKTAETEIAAGAYRGALHGIPLAHKDVICTAGVPTTNGSEAFRNYVPAADATAVAALHEAGAILLGKVNTNEFALITSSPCFGIVHNPWNVECNPGGSSSGSGAAVAAGLCAGSLGTDTGGSIRIPAAFCGIVGLKPTHSRIGMRGIVRNTWSASVVGPMTRTVEDAALLLQALTARPAGDPTASAHPVDDYVGSLDTGVQGLRIGVPTWFFDELTDAEVTLAYQEAVKVLSELGAVPVHVNLPELVRDAWGALQVIMKAESNVWHGPRLQRFGDKYGPYVRRFLERGRSTPAVEYFAAQTTVQQLSAGMLSLYAEIDVLLVPSALIPAPAIGVTSIEAHGEPTPLMTVITASGCVFSLTNQPALAVPCGFTRSGLPLSLQVVGKPFDEATVLRVGHAYQAATSWSERRPELPAERTEALA